VSGRPYEIVVGDVRRVLREMEPESFDAAFADPPYGLEFMHGSGGVKWDYDVPSVNAFVEVLRVLRPGAFAFFFGGTRTFHRMAVNVEDAGFLPCDVCMWLYASGWPKSLDIAKELDKKRGRWRDRATSVVSQSPALGGPHYGMTDKGAAISEEARRWDGQGTALKPAWEILEMVQKPLDLKGIVVSLAHKLTEVACQLSSLAKIADRLSSSSRDALAPLGSVLWDAVQQCSSPDDLFGVMATSRSDSTVPTSLSIVSSWLDTLNEILRRESTFTIETASSLTTALRTLNSSLSKITPELIIEVATSGRGMTPSASLAVASFAVAAAGLEFTLASSAVALVTSEVASSDLAPDYEPLLLVSKPHRGTIADNAVTHGVGGLDIEASRIGSVERFNAPAGNDGSSPASIAPKNVTGYAGKKVKGRWPANVVLSHAPDCVRVGERVVKTGTAVKRNGVKNRGALDGMHGRGTYPVGTPDAGYGVNGKETIDAYECVEGCPVRLLDLQSGDRPGMSGGGRHRPDYPGGMFGGVDSTDTARGDRGGASRFFFTSKVSREERDRGLENFETVPHGVGAMRDGSRQGRAKNGHSTLKPIDLCRYFARMLLPPPRADGKPRRLLVPFSGAGSEIIGALQAGWDEVVGIELVPKHAAWAMARIAKGQIIRHSK